MFSKIDITTLTDSATISEKIREHEMLSARLRCEVAALGDEHADQWVGMGQDCNLVFGENLAEVISQLNRGKSDESTVVVKYLSAEPMEMIL